MSKVTPIRVIVGLVPLAALVGFLLMGDEARRALLERFPEGAGARVARVGVTLAVLTALAWGALPITYHPERWCRFGAAWIRGKRGTARVALSPVLLLVEILRGLALVLFLATAVAVIATFLLACVYAVQVVAPGFLGGWTLDPGGFGD